MMYSLHSTYKCHRSFEFLGRIELGIILTSTAVHIVKLFIQILQLFYLIVAQLLEMNFAN